MQRVKATIVIKQHQINFSHSALANFRADFVAAEFGADRQIHFLKLLIKTTSHRRRWHDLRIAVGDRDLPQPKALLLTIILNVYQPFSVR